MSAISELHALGQSLWYDNIQRSLLESGALADMIARGDIRGITSNPSIFNNAIAKTNDYDSALIPMAWAGWNAEDIFTQLAIEDIQAAADLFRPLFDETHRGDGYVSLEVSPFLAKTTEGTVAEAKRLWQAVDRPNLMIKIPATREGIPAIEQVIAAGINVNVTLIFSLTRYAEVMQAYLNGLEKRVKAHQPIDTIASVASFFVSRVDTKVDARLAKVIDAGGSQVAAANRLLGKAAIANAKLAYAEFIKVFGSERFAALQKAGAQLQRPLWASTSTKNPAYRDVLYVEQLIGPHTVNTVPPQTLDAFRDHGMTNATLGENLDDASQTFAALEELGISMQAVTDELETEGVKAFADAFSALLHSIEERRALAVNELGPLQADVPVLIGKLESEKIVNRLYAADPTLWTDEPAGQAEIRKRLGWLALPETSRKIIPEIQSFVQGVIDAGFRKVLLLGMGGSSLAPEVFSLVQSIDGESVGKADLKLTVLDSTDPDQVRAAAAGNPVEETLYLVSSKSGSTSEVKAFLDYFWTAAEQNLGAQAGSHFVAITDPGTSLERLAGERGFRFVFKGDPDVGGRFSALSVFGLVPAALIGLDLEKLLDRAQWMAAQCGSQMPTGRNPGIVLGAIMGLAARQGRDKLTLLADPLGLPLGAWLEQLIAESSGKQGRGIVPVVGEPAVTAQNYGQDRLFVYLCHTGDLGEAVDRLRNSGQPVITLPFSHIEDLGAEFFRWEVATAVATSIMAVNGFDQPDVQDNKTRTGQKISEFQKQGRLEDSGPTWEGEGIRVYGGDPAALRGAKTIRDVLNGFFAQANAGDYVALNAYVPRSPTFEKQLTDLRAAIQKQTHLATTLGFGPRFLHSTGQLHKGGANNGLFLQITREPERDLEIPNEGITFGTLERAQALGDFEALAARGRRTMRVHLVDANIEALN